MNDRPSARGLRPADPHPRLRQAALAAVITGVVLLAAAAFLLSYAGIHHIARAAGVPPTLARLYPLIFDAMLVIASSAVLALRGAGWLTRCYVWLSLLLLLAAVAAGDAVHAIGLALPRKPASATVAVIPWVLVLLAFGLLLAMLRQVRRARAAAASPGTAVPGSGAVTIVPPTSGPGGSQPARMGIDSLLDPRPGSTAPRLGDRLVAPAPSSAAVASTGAAASQITGGVPPDATGPGGTGQGGSGPGAAPPAVPPGGNGEAAAAGAGGEHSQYDLAAGLGPEEDDEDSWVFEDLDADGEPELDHEQEPGDAEAGGHEAAYGADEGSADEHGADEHGADEHGADEHGPDEHGPDEHGPDEHGPDEHGPDEHGRDEHGPDEDSTDEDSTDEDSTEDDTDGDTADEHRADEQEPVSGQALPLSAPPPAQFDRLRSRPTPPQD